MTTNFIRGANPIWFMANLTGQPLDDRYWAFFLNNVFPYAMDNDHRVWQDPAHTTPWSNPIEFQPSSGLPNNIYFDPAQTWRIEIRKGNTQTDQLIYAINNYMPGSGTSSVIENPLQFAQNIITNPQFSDIYFTSPFTYTQTNPAEYIVPVGPGWDLVLTGAGTTILTQHAIDGASGSPGNPPYSLEINNSLWTSAVLRQRLSNNGAIFAGGAVGVSFDGNAVISPATVSITYNTSFGAEVLLITKSLPTGGLVAYKNAEDIPASASSDLPPTDAYVDIQINLPSGRVVLTNIQVTGQSTPLPDGFVAATEAPSFQELTYAQVVNAEFNVYQNSIMILPKNTIATGWNFRLNPWQFTKPVTGIVVGTTPVYTADQTIVVAREAASITVNRCNDPYGLLQIVASGATQGENIAIFQYIDTLTMMQYFGPFCSILVRARIVGDTQVRLKARMFTCVGTPNTLATNDPISSWTAAGDPVFDALYSPRSPVDDPNPVILASYDTSQGTPVCPAMAFNSINTQIVNSTPAATMGVMIYTVGALAQNDVILIESISVVPNTFAIDSTPETYDESLRKCQFYFEYSWNPGSDVDLPATGLATVVGAATYIAPVATSTKLTGLNTPFKVIKRATPTMEWYSTINTSASGFITLGEVLDVAVTGKDYIGAARTGFPIVAGGAVNAGDLVTAHWTADSRMGLP